MFKTHQYYHFRQFSGKPNNLSFLKSLKTLILCLFKLFWYLPKIPVLQNIWLLPFELQGQYLRKLISGFWEKSVAMNRFEFKWPCCNAASQVTELSFWTILNCLHTSCNKEIPLIGRAKFEHGWTWLTIPNQK